MLRALQRKVELTATTTGSATLASTEGRAQTPKQTRRLNASATIASRMALL